MLYKGQFAISMLINVHHIQRGISCLILVFTNRTIFDYKMHLKKLLPPPQLILNSELVGQ